MHAWSTSESRLVWIRKHSSILFKSQVTALLLSALVLLILKTDRERKQGFLDFDINYYRRCFNQQLNTSLIGTCLFKSTCFAIFGAELCNHEIVTLQLTTKIYASILCKSIVLDCTLAKKKWKRYVILVYLLLASATDTTHSHYAIRESWQPVVLY